jgi:hypothetical protein
MKANLSVMLRFRAPLRVLFWRNISGLTGHGFLYQFAINT